MKVLLAVVCAFFACSVWGDAEFEAARAFWKERGHTALFPHDKEMESGAHHAQDKQAAFRSKSHTSADDSDFENYDNSVPSTPYGRPPTHRARTSLTRRHAVALSPTLSVGSDSGFSSDSGFESGSDSDAMKGRGRKTPPTSNADSARLQSLHTDYRKSRQDFLEAVEAHKHATQATRDAENLAVIREDPSDQPAGAFDLRPDIIQEREKKDAARKKAFHEHTQSAARVDHAYNAYLDSHKAYYKERMAQARTDQQKADVMSRAFRTPTAIPLDNIEGESHHRHEDVRWRDAIVGRHQHWGQEMRAFREEAPSKFQPKGRYTHPF